MSSKPVLIRPDAPQEAYSALQRGDIAALALALTEGSLEPNVLASALNTVCRMAIELRRESVAMLGSHEAFVRHGDNGSLRQVIRPVRLSLHKRTLYQITERKKVKGEWVDVVVGDPTVADLTYPGYIALNGVAGCAVGQPPTVNVDGERRTNPFVERAESRNGRLGEVLRVVVAVAVVGPSPVTGNPVVVNYTHEFDPAQEFQHTLADIAENFPDDCYLINEWYAEEKRDRDWGYVPIGGGFGYRFNMKLDRILQAFKDNSMVQGQAIKKAQTVARRNAMKSHPALGIQTVVIDGDGCAVVPVIGWANTDGDLNRWLKIQEKLARGEQLPEADKIETIDIEPEVYKAEAEVYNAEEPTRSQVEVASLGDDQVERNQLIEQIDLARLKLTPKQAATVGTFDPSSQSIEDLVVIKDLVDSMVTR